MESLGGPEYAAMVTEQDGNNLVFENCKDAEVEAACQDGLMVELQVNKIQKKPMRFGFPSPKYCLISLNLFFKRGFEALLCPGLKRLLSPDNTFFIHAHILDKNKNRFSLFNIDYRLYSAMQIIPPENIA
ncbi:hypothetical protein [Mucilaginibacter sp.]